MYIDPTKPDLGFNGYAMIARDGNLQYGACGIASDGSYLYTPSA